MSNPLAVPNAARAPLPNDPLFELDRWLAGLGDAGFLPLLAGAPGPFAALADPREPSPVPALSDVEDTGAAYEIRADLPGVPKEKIEVRVHGDVVEFGAETEAVDESTHKNYLRRERTCRGFHRAVRLPEPVVGEKVEARYVNGTLQISVPKAHPSADRTVPVA